jgi:membrane associated rhomboid family serine protease
MSSRTYYTDRAQNALFLLIIINLFVCVYRVHLSPYLDLRRTYRIRDGSFHSMLLSIFYHMDSTHLFINMLSLHQNGTKVFVNSSSKRWQSMFVIIISYIVCGIGAFIGLDILSQYHNARYATKCTHWLCQSLNDALAHDVSSYVTNIMNIRYFDTKLGIAHYQLLYRTGSSGVVYGWMGMRLISSFLSPYHSTMDGLDLFFIVATIGYDLKESPLSLNNLRVSVLLDDSVDHATRVSGFLCGIVWALILTSWIRLTIRWRWWRGTGRRLGASWEDQQRLQQEREERRQNSRLINIQQRGQQRGRVTRTVI